MTTYRGGHGVGWERDMQTIEDESEDWRAMWTVWDDEGRLLHAHDTHLDAVHAARYEALTHGGEVTVRRPGGAVDRRVGCPDPERRSPGRDTLAQLARLFAGPREDVEF